MMMMKFHDQMSPAGQSDEKFHSAGLFYIYIVGTFCKAE